MADTEKDKSSRPEVFLGKGVLEVCSKTTGEQPRPSTISIKLQSNFIEIELLEKKNFERYKKRPFLLI